MNIETFPYKEVITLIIALMTAIWGWYQGEQKKKVTEFFTNPVSVANSNSNSVIQKIPEKSWKMEDWTKKWICAGESDEDKKDLLAQIDKAESEGLTSYTIHYSKGFYLIEWGLIKSSGRDGK